MYVGTTPYGNQPQIYHAPPPPAHGYGVPSVITVNNSASGTPCPFCGSNTENYTERVIGGTAIAWAISLCCLGAGLCFWIPFVTDGCLDVQLKCVRCLNVKANIPAQCC